MSRISATFEQLQKQGRKALIPYITAGDPYADITLELMHTLVASGADVIELGVPFSDPMADGPVIQRASERALAKGMNLVKILEIVHTFRQTDTKTPVMLMGYANPIEHYDFQRGQNQFAIDASAAGVDGVLVVDYPPEESQIFSQQLKQHGMDQIFLLAPTSTPGRIKMVENLASGFVYYVSLKGVTGAANFDTTSVTKSLPILKKNISIPICVGFGIRDAASAQAVAAVADGVVIGSRLIELIENQSRGEVLTVAGAFITELRQALDCGNN